MPICRLPLPSAPPPEQARVRLSHYLVTRRPGLRAANDNRRAGFQFARMNRLWPWAVAVAAAPTLTAAAMLSGLF